MSQVVEFSKLSEGSVSHPSWAARLRHWLLSRRPARLVHFANPSMHLLRDIGMADDPRSNRLLQDHYLKR